jgi:hypothetical protein
MAAALAIDLFLDTNLAQRGASENARFDAAPEPEDWLTQPNASSPP